jgi:SAM-dependent methyltransferase
MRNPWLDIPLDDYEAHMALPYVGQAPLLRGLFEDALARREPRSVALLGCAGGNGLDCTPESVARIVAIDINAAYIERARERHGARLGAGRIEFYVGDVEATPLALEPVDLVFAGLLFEYVDARATLINTRRMLVPGGTLVAVLQLPGETAEVTPSPYTSLAALSPAMKLVPPRRLQSLAEETGYRLLDEHAVEATGGKRFRVQEFGVSKRPE